MRSVIILKTDAATLKQVVDHQMHALKGSLSRVKSDDLLLIAEIQRRGGAIARYGMWFNKLRPPLLGEIATIWGNQNAQRWNNIVEGRECQKLLKEFNPEKEKVSSKNYGRGGGGMVVYVEEEDITAFRQKRLLAPFL